MSDEAIQWTKGMPTEIGFYYLMETTKFGDTVEWCVCSVCADCFYIAGVERVFLPHEGAAHFFAPIPDPSTFP